MSAGNDEYALASELQTVDEVAYVRPVVMFEAVCTCGWKQVHTLKSNAEHDAKEHKRNGRHR